MDRQIIKIAVSAEAKDAIEAMCERYGMSQIELASRIYQWASEQDEVVQAAILGILPDEVAPDVARLVLKRLAQGGAEPNPAKKAAKKARPTSHVTRKRPGRGGEKHD